MDPAIKLGEFAEQREVEARGELLQLGYNFAEDPIWKNPVLPRGNGLPKSIRQD
jgi:hypothetical protein